MAVVDEGAYLDADVEGAWVVGVVVEDLVPVAGVGPEQVLKAGRDRVGRAGPAVGDPSAASCGQPRPISQCCASGTTGWRSDAKPNVRCSMSRVMCRVTYSAVPGMSQIADRSYSRCVNCTFSGSLSEMNSTPGSQSCRIYIVS